MLKSFSAIVIVHVPSLPSFSSEVRQTTTSPPLPCAYRPLSSFQATIVTLKAFCANVKDRVPSLPTFSRDVR